MNPSNAPTELPSMEFLLGEFDRIAAQDAPDHHPRITWRLSAVGAGALAVAGALAITLAPSSNSPLAPSEASAELSELALAASAFNKSEPLKRGQFYFNEIVSGDHVTRRWVSQDAALYAERPRRDSYARVGSLGGSPGVYAYLPGTAVPLTYEEIVAFPRDPHALYGFIADRIQLSIEGDSRPEENVVMFETISEFVTSYPLPSDLRAAFYKTAALIPGVQDLGSVETPDGRVGLGIGRDGNDIVFNRRTGEIIGAGTVKDGEVRRSIMTMVVDRVGALR